jgi:hypothetical protein
LPAPYDSEGDKISSFILDFGDLANIAGFNSYSNKVSIEKDVVTWRNDGVWPVEIRLSDVRGGSESYWFDIVIDCPPPPPRPPTPEEIAFIESLSEPDPVELLPEGLTEIAADEFSTPFIKAISSTGIVEIGF